MSCQLPIVLVVGVEQQLSDWQILILTQMEISLIMKMLQFKQPLYILRKYYVRSLEYQVETNPYLKVSMLWYSTGAVGSFGGHLNPFQTKRGIFCPPYTHFSGVLLQSQKFL